MDSSIVDRYKDSANRLTIASMDVLAGIYADDIWFIDPIHEVRGLANLRAYYERLYKHVAEIAFEFADTVVQGDAAALSWTMRLRHTRFRPSETLELAGVTMLRYTNKITYQRDYFDVGAMIYERLPLIGFAVTRVKRRL